MTIECVYVSISEVDKFHQQSNYMHRLLDYKGKANRKGKKRNFIIC